MSGAHPAAPPGEPPAQEGLTAPARSWCPVEAVLPDGRHACTLERGHRGIHDFDSDPLPSDIPAQAVTPGQADTLTISASTAERDELAAKLARALAANQRWAETLGDIQQAARERDAHKLRADHYEGLWRAEHGLPPDGSGAPDEASELHDRVDRLEAECTERHDNETALRELAAEMLDEFDQWELLVEDDKRAGWRERLEAI